MANRSKKGLDFFNIDCVQEDNLNYVEAKFGIIGYGVVIKLWRKIYMIDGYYCEWGEKNLYLFSKEIGVDPQVIKDVVDLCFSEGIFDKSMADNYNILTSHGTQKRWKRTVHMCKRKDCEIDEKFLISDKTPEETQKTPEEIEKTQAEIPQTKVKESKVKESKEKERVSPSGDCETDVSRVQKIEFENLAKDKRSLIEFIQRVKPQFIDPYILAWNFFARENGLAEVLKTSDVRKRKFRARIREKGFDFINILSEAKKSPFLLEGKWFAFDWLIENESNYLKILEGNYKAKAKDEKGQVITSKMSIEDLRLQFSDKIDPKLIRPEHFDDLGLSELTLENAKVFRISKLIGTNKGPELRLIQKYKDGIVDAETEADLPMLKRIAVHQYFTSLNQGA